MRIVKRRERTEVYYPTPHNWFSSDLGRRGPRGQAQGHDADVDAAPEFQEHGGGHGEAAEDVARHGGGAAQEVIRVVVHYAGTIEKATMAAIAQERLHLRTNDPHFRPAPIEMSTTLVYCPPAQKHAYGDSLVELWKWKRPFINLEGDVAPWPGALTQLWTCPESWCALPLIVHGAVNNTNLGCVKFSARFIERHPDLWATYPRNDIFDWRSLDAWLHGQLAPMRPHHHGPPALHINPEHIKEGVSDATQGEFDPSHGGEQEGVDVGPASRGAHQG